MKKYLIFILSIIISLSSQLITAQNTSELTVIVKNIEIIEGTLELKLSSDSLQYRGDIEANLDLVRTTKVTKNEMVFTFNNLPEGEYALSIFQDINENGKLDRKKFGIPAEPFAFSNDALRRFGPPYFEQAKFYVEKGENTQELNLIYRKPKKVEKDKE